jgi:hypothetical protein
MRISDEGRIGSTFLSRTSSYGQIQGKPPITENLPLDDAVQLSSLCGVLNAFQSNAAKAATHAAELSAAIRQQAYSLDSLTLSKKMLRECLTPV